MHSCMALASPLTGCAPARSIHSLPSSSPASVVADNLRKRAYRAYTFWECGEGEGTAQRETWCGDGPGSGSSPLPLKIVRHHALHALYRLESPRSPGPASLCHNASLHLRATSSTMQLQRVPGAAVSHGAFPHMPHSRSDPTPPRCAFSLEFSVALRLVQPQIRSGLYALDSCRVYAVSSSPASCLSLKRRPFRAHGSATYNPGRLTRHLARRAWRWRRRLSLAVRGQYNGDRATVAEGSFSHAFITSVLPGSALVPCL